MKKRITIATVAETRERKVCPSCESLEIYKLRHHNGFYKCNGCHAVFQSPSVKRVKIHKSFPAKLKEILEKKKRTKAAELQETIL